MSDEITTDLARLRGWMTSLSEVVRDGLIQDPARYVLAANSHGDELTIGHVVTLLSVYEAACAWRDPADAEAFDRAHDALTAAVDAARGGR